ncbi:MAG TPA: efflux RND transporter periplasmic adaptor subunit [Bacteroidales bacterium]
MKLKLLHLTGTFFLVISVISCHSKTSETRSAKQKLSGLRVEGYIVTPTVLDQTITVSGTLKPFEETVLMPEVSGRVVSINLPEGKDVKCGTVLIELFNGDLQAQLQKAQAELKIAEENLNRQSELIKVEGISKSDFDQAQLQVSSIKADIEVLNVQIGRTKIRAPFDGTVGLRNISLGAQVTPSTALVTIRDIKQLKLDFSVPEKYSGRIKPGTKLKFTVQGDEKKYDATVMATEQGIETSTRNLNSRAIVKSQSASIIPGAFANVELRLDENKQALLVPTQSIIPQERDKRLIVSKQGKAKFVTIKTGIRTASKVEVLSGIENGDTIITTGILFLRPGADLRFSKVKRDTI